MNKAISKQNDLNIDNYIKSKYPHNLKTPSLCDLRRSIIVWMYDEEGIDADEIELDEDMLRLIDKYIVNEKLVLDVKKYPTEPQLAELLNIETPDYNTALWIKHAPSLSGCARRVYINLNTSNLPKEVADTVKKSKIYYNIVTNKIVCEVASIYNDISITVEAQNHIKAVTTEIETVIAKILKDNGYWRTIVSVRQSHMSWVN